MAEKNVAKRVGGIRPSQIMYTYGVGATIELPNFTVIVAGLDDWDDSKQTIIREERLLRAVRQDKHVGTQVTELRGAPWEPETRNVFESWAYTGVPVIPFPRWLRCSKCNLLSTIDSRLFELDLPATKPHQARYVHKCNVSGKSPTAMPARFVVACPDGHLDEFPWDEFCHKGGTCTSNPLLEVFDIGEGTRSTNIGVRCKTCHAENFLGSAFGPDSGKVLPKCRGRMPHLREVKGTCTNQTVALLLGASNAWFAVTRSALSIPAAVDLLGQLVAEHIVKLSTIPNREMVGPMLAMADELRPLQGFPADQIWDEIEERRDGGSGSEADLDLISPEWLVLTNPGTAPASDDFQLKAVGAPLGFEGRIAPTVLAERLREVVALTGFTRLDGPDSGVASDQAPARTVALSRHRPKWLPAAETRGEGLFLRLPEDVVAAWETQVAGTPRPEALQESYKRWRRNRNLDPSGGWPGDRYILLHSLSHALINVFALECGYAAASIRERIYCREPNALGTPMAGILLYTAAPDSEGTLGGLVSLGHPDVLGRLLNQALDRAKLCSTDPTCADHLPEEHDITLHGASCHACLFVPETSCESGNRFLDRAALIRTLSNSGIEYFDGQ
jgi:hypothetical protein